MRMKLFTRTLRIYLSLGFLVGLVFAVLMCTLNSHPQAGHLYTAGLALPRVARRFAESTFSRGVPHFSHTGMSGGPKLLPQVI